MSVARLLSGRPSKRARTTATRIAVTPDVSTMDESPVPTQITYREQRFHPSTGRTYLSEPVYVHQDPSLPPEDTEIGLDLDSTENDNAVDAEYDDVEQATKDEAKRQRLEKKKKKRSLASVSF